MDILVLTIRTGCGQHYDLIEQGNVIQYVDGYKPSYGLYLNRGEKLMLIYDAKQAVPRQFYDSAVVDYDDYRMSTSRAPKSPVSPDSNWRKNG